MNAIVVAARLPVFVARKLAKVYRMGDVEVRAVAVLHGGLDPGAVVIAYPADAVADGVRVKAPGSGRT